MGSSQSLTISMSGGAVELGITLVNGKDIKQLNWLDKPDPFVICGLGSKKIFETKVVDNSANPTWNYYHKTTWNGKDKLSFQVQEANDVFLDQPIGTAEVKSFASGFNGSIPVLDKDGKPAGSLTVKVVVLKHGPCGGCCPVS